MQLTPSLEIMNSKKTKILMKFLYDEFGIEEKPEFVFLKSNKNKVYVVNRDIERIELERLRIDSVGLYFGTYQIDGFRPSIEGSQLLSKYAKKNIIELNREQKHSWLKGRDIELNDSENRYVLVKSGKDFLGSGKVKNGVLMNAVPKSRRLVVVNE